MPVLPVVRVASVDDAIALAVQLEGGCHHTAAMHSRNIDNMNQMANAIDTSIFVKNGPCIAGLGLGGGLDHHDHHHANRGGGDQCAHLRSPAALRAGGCLPNCIRDDSWHTTNNVGSPPQTAKSGRPCNQTPAASESPLWLGVDFSTCDVVSMVADSEGSRWRCV